MHRFAAPALATALLASACKAPPPAPEGLDASASFMVRNFFADDLTFGSGIDGFMTWFEEEGVSQLGQEATLEDSDTFTVGHLTMDDIGYLPLEEDVLVDAKEDEYIPRDPGLAPGVVSLAEMDCDWLTAEDYLVRPDQDNVFAGDWEGYDRTYVTARDTFQDASASGTFAPVDAPLDPFSDGFDPEAYAETLLMTDNLVDPTRVVTSNIGEYPMDLDIRHGIFDIGGEPTGVFAILTYMPQAAWGESENNALLQSYSIELNVQRPGDKTLRMLTVWAEPYDGTGIIQPDGNVALTYAVNKSLDSSNRMSDICAGRVEIDE